MIFATYSKESKRVNTDPMSAPVRRISVVIPCYNDARLLEPTLRSLTQQSLPFYELIVVDNNCTDDSAAVARNFGARVVKESWQGISFATRAGFDAATGDVLMRTDADIAAGPDFHAVLQEVWRGIDKRNARGVGRRIVGWSGGARFSLPGWRGDVVSALYLWAYRLSVSSALGHAPFFGTNFCIDAAWWQKRGKNVDFSDPEVHEDLHLSFMVQPDESVEFHPRVRVATDARAVRGTTQLRRRFARGIYTMQKNFRTQSPPQRLRERAMFRLSKESK